MSKSMNVDPNEIRKFEELASRWWDRNSEFKPLHDINPLRADWIESLAPLNGQQVLDVGCGGGILCEALAERGANVTGIDMGDAPLAVGNLHKLESGVEVNYCQVDRRRLCRKPWALLRYSHLPGNAGTCARSQLGG